MKIIIPVAGRGTRVRPHTYSKPKPFMRVGKTTAIQFIIDHLLTLNPEEIIIITDRYNASYVQVILPELYPDVKFHFAVQPEQLGPLHAYWYAKPFINQGDEIFVNNCDTLFVKDLDCIKDFKADYESIVFVKEVEDYKRFGVVLHENNILTNVVEKPDEPISKLAVIGAYYFRDGYKFMQMADEIIKADRKRKGEFYLPVLYMDMIKNGERVRVEDVDDWLDVGKIETILESNSKLLQGGVWKGENSEIVDSHVSENVSIGKNTKVINCIVKNSIIGNNTILEGMEIRDSVIGDKVTLRRDGKVFNVGDESSML